MKKTIFALFSILIMGITVYGQKKMIDFEQLPAEAKQFVKTNFPNETVRKFIKEIKPKYSEECEFSVALCRDTDVFELSPKPPVKWEDVKNKIHCLPTNFLLPDIRNFLEAKHPGNCIKEVERVRYKIKVETANGIELIFNNDGAFIEYDD